MVAPGNSDIRQLDPALCLSASMRLGRFGYGSGSIETMEVVEVGELISVSIGDASVGGAVVSVIVNQANGSHTLELLDPGTAMINTVSVEAGATLTDQIHNVLSSIGVSVQGYVETSVVPYPSNDPVPWAEWVRMVCITVGMELAYRGGEYLAFEMEPPSVAISGNQVIEASLTSDPASYANIIAISVDDEWTESAQLLEEMTESIGGLTTTTRSWGDQVVFLRQKDNVTNQEVKEEWSYDDHGYCTRYERTELSPEPDGSDGTKQEVITTFKMTDDENVYSYETLETTKEYTWWANDPTETPQWGWCLSAEKKTFASVDLRGLSVITSMEREVENRKAFTWDLKDRRKTETRIFRKESEAGASTERTVVRTWKSQVYLEWPSNNEAWRWVPDGSGVSGGDALECLIMSPKVKKHSVHLEAIVVDTDAVNAVGEIRKEVRTVCLNSIHDLETYGKGELKEASLVRQIRITMPQGSGLIPGRRFSWNGETWIVNAVEVSLDERSEIIEAVTAPPLEDLRPILLGRPDLASSILMSIRNHGRTTTNIERGSVVGRVGQDSFTIQTGKGLLRASRGYLDSGPIAIGETVLLAKPSGKDRCWTMVARPKERGVLRSTVDTAVLVPAPAYNIESSQILADGNGMVTLTWKETGAYARVAKYEIIVIEQVMEGGIGSRGYGEQRILWASPPPSSGERSFDIALPGAQFSIAVEAFLSSGAKLGTWDLGTVLNLSLPVFRLRNSEIPVNVINECELPHPDVVDLVMSTHKDIEATLDLSGCDLTITRTLHDNSRGNITQIIVRKSPGSSLWAYTELNKDGDFEFGRPDEAIPTGLTNTLGEGHIGGSDSGLPVHTSFLKKKGVITPLISGIPGVLNIQGESSAVVEIPDLEFAIPQYGPFISERDSFRTYAQQIRYDVQGPYCLRSNSMGFSFTGEVAVFRCVSIMHLKGTEEYVRFFPGPPYNTSSLMDAIPSLLFCNRVRVQIYRGGGNLTLHGDPPTSADIDMFYRVEVLARGYYHQADNEWGYAWSEYPRISFPDVPFKITVPVHQEIDPLTEVEKNTLSSTIEMRPIVISCIPKDEDTGITSLSVVIAGAEMTTSLPTKYLWSGLDPRGEREQYNKVAIVRVEKTVAFDGVPSLQNKEEERARVLWSMELMPPGESMAWGAGVVFSPYKETIDIPSFVLDPGV